MVNKTMGISLYVTTGIVDDLWNPRELHNRGIYHLVHVQLGSLDGSTDSLDHGKPKRHKQG